jgi:Uma2 family endonuclease
MDTRTETKLDYAAYAAIPADGKRYELLDGELHVTPSPRPLHQRIVLGLAKALERRLGPGVEVFVSPLDVIITRHDVLQPDIVAVAQPSQVSARGIEGPPLLVVEVLSPTTRAYDRTEKAAGYARLGVPHYWIVDPMARRIECLRQWSRGLKVIAVARELEILTHPDFPRLKLPLARLWR